MTKERAKLEVLDRYNEYRKEQGRDATNDMSKQIEAVIDLFIELLDEKVDKGRTDEDA